MADLTDETSRPEQRSRRADLDDALPEHGARAGRMRNEVPTEREVSLAREIFGPLGGIIQLGAASGTSPQKPLRHISVGQFLEPRRRELDRILAAVRDVGDFHAGAMAIHDELGYHREHEIAAPSLLLWSGCIEQFSPHLDEPLSVRRMVRAGVDIQLTQLMHALVGAASHSGIEEERGSELILEIIGLAATVAGIDRDDAARDVFRMWRVAFLYEVLLPSSRSPEAIKRDFRRLAHVIESLLEGEGRR
ncbi:hypothetical protein ABZ208_04865 [Streptomyces sp. NPDC006208]|uniref:hypothetical protein n=1 Tax=Streptomyces sp. NPDC006208 TaxID=3156734 RepID=UPI0033A3C7FE